MSGDIPQKRTFYFTFTWGSNILEHEEEEPVERTEHVESEKGSVVEAESVLETENETETKEKTETSAEEGEKEKEGSDKEPVTKEGEGEEEKEDREEQNVETAAEPEVEEAAESEQLAPVEVEELEAQKIPAEVIVTGTFDDWSCSHPMKLDTSDSVFRLIVPLHLDPHDVYGRVHFKFVVDGQWMVNESYPMDMDDKGNQNNYLTIGYVEKHSMTQKFRRIKKYKKNKRTGERILIQEKVVEIDDDDNIVRVVESINHRLVPTNESKEAHTPAVNPKLYEITEGDFSSSLDENDGYDAVNTGAILNNEDTDRETASEGEPTEEPKQAPASEAADKEEGEEDEGENEGEEGEEEKKTSKDTKAKDSAKENKPKRQTVSAPAATGVDDKQTGELPKKRGLIGKLQEFFY